MRHPQTTVEKRRRKADKNRWLSRERYDGTALEAVCDWSVPSPSKPFFPQCNVHGVDKRHHPADSLINCEMYSYLPLSYSCASSRTPRCYLLPPPPLPLLYCSIKEKKQASFTRSAFCEKKKQHKKIILLSKQIFCLLSLPSHIHMYTTLCKRGQNTHSLFKEPNGNARTKGAHIPSEGLWGFKVVLLSHKH